MLQAEALRVAYGNRLVLKDISFQVNAGMILGVIGPNGAGKTTLVRALSGVVPLLGGSVRVMGCEIAALSPV